MAIRNQNWYNLQETRRYPLDDISTGEDDNGGVLRDNIIVDCHIRFPSTLGNYLYIQGLTISNGLVTVVFGAAQNMSAERLKTIAAVSLQKPIDQNINYAITSIVPGVAGWVAFGSGVLENFSGRYSSPKQTLIQQRCARRYSALPISSLSKTGLSNKLSGVVNIAASLPLTALYQETPTNTVIDPISRQSIPAKNVIILELDQDLNSDEFNPLIDFIGPCGQRPESGTCGQEPISTLNGVAPDCDGNINIVFSGLEGRLFKDCGGIDIITNQSLEVSCTPQENKIEDGEDVCAVDENGNRIPPLEYLSDLVGNEIDIVVEDIVTVDYPCTTSACLNSCEATSQFNLVSGSFLTDIANGPPPEARTQYDETTAGDRYFLALSPGGISVAIFKNCPSNWSANKSIKTAFRFTDIGPEKNAGIVLNYKSDIVNGQTVKTYVAAVLDAQKSAIKILRFDTFSFIEEHSVPFNVNPAAWYAMHVIPVTSGDGTATVQVYVTEMLTGVQASASAVIGAYGVPDGGIGLLTQNAYTYFSYFEIE